MANKYIFTSESVTEGHPDKVCDQISDALLDAMLAKDPNTRAGIETFATTGLVVVGGEVTTKTYVDAQKVIRETIRDIGYDDHQSGFHHEDVGVLVALDEQSPDIAQGVDKGKGRFKEQGAGDQGLMFGYATNETPELMPLPIMMSHKLVRQLAKVRKNGTLKYLGPDGKAEVAIEYVDDIPTRATAIVISTQHTDGVSPKKLEADIIRFVVKPVVGKYLTKRTKFYINATGRFVKGGPAADAGLTGRKIIVDTYGGSGRHGGGAFSGKDPSKVDRSAAYAARYIAKNIVAAGLADRCEVQLSYVIGVADPVSILVNTFDTGKLSDQRLAQIVRKHFALKPADIVRMLKLRRPIYKKTAAYGHFGRNDKDFTWEKTDKAATLKKYLTNIK